MTRRSSILLLSAGLNVVLLSAWLSARRHASLPVPGSFLSRAVTASNAPGRTHVVFRRQVFSWREVESPDYTTYIARLRDIGCPESTIRDIIVADVNQLYARKRLAETPAMDQEWWRSTPDTNRFQATTAKIAALETERRTVLDTLLGPDWEAPDAAASRPLVSLNGPVLGALSPETKQTVEDIVARSQQRVDAYVAAQSAAGQALDPAVLARIRLEARNDLAKGLAPAELEEFLLRYSQTAINLRRDFATLQLTPDEFRNVFRAVDALDQQLRLDYSPDNPATASQRAALEQRRSATILATLGPERAREYQSSLAQAAATPAPVAVPAVETDAPGTVPPSVAPTLFAINQATAQEIARINADPNLTAEQKAAQITAVQEQQQAARAQVLGQAATPPLPPAAPGIHSFSPGETLDGIASQYGVSIGNLLQANPNLNINQLSKGLQIRIPQVAK